MIVTSFTIVTSGRFFFFGSVWGSDGMSERARGFWDVMSCVFGGGGVCDAGRCRSDG